MLDREKERERERQREGERGGRGKEERRPSGRKMKWQIIEKKKRVRMRGSR